MTASPPPAPPDPNDIVILGQISGAFGTRGWVKIHSYTRPREHILDFDEWCVGRPGAWETYRVVGARVQGPSLIVALQGLDSREAADALRRAQVGVPRVRLPAPEPGEYYWVDLIGMEVMNQDGASLGRVVRLTEAGDHDVLVTRDSREHLIPFVRGIYVLNVDPAARRIMVDWHADD
ncbi:MAG: ribosome maturation factor RimM [Gammaproteobacteria bacterium]